MSEIVRCLNDHYVTIRDPKRNLHEIHVVDVVTEGMGRTEYIEYTNSYMNMYIYTHNLTVNVHINQNLWSQPTQ